MTVASSRGTEIVACGRAKPTRTAVTASSEDRRRQMAQPAGRPVDDVREQRGRSRSGDACAPAAPVEQDVARRRRAARAAEPSSASGHCEAHRRALPRAGTATSARSQSPEVESTTWRDAGRGEQRRASRVRSAAAASAKRCAQPRAARVDAELAAGLGVDEPELADVRQLLLARVADLDGDARRGGRRAPAAAGASRGGPRKSETTTTSARWRASRADAAERLAERRRRPAPCSSAASSRSAAAGRAGPARPCRGGSVRGSASPKVTTPRRLPRRVATWPIASAAPSATSALRRSAVPNVIEGEVSSTSQVVSARSARWTRTCGIRVRAVTFQSIRRTSSPRLVRADLRELGADAEQRRAVVAGEQALDAAADREVERPQQRARASARARAAPGSGAGARRLERLTRRSPPRGRSAAPAPGEHLVEDRVRR